MEWRRSHYRRTEVCCHGFRCGGVCACSALRTTNSVYPFCPLPTPLSLGHGHLTDVNGRFGSELPRSASGRLPSQAVTSAIGDRPRISKSSRNNRKSWSVPCCPSRSTLAQGQPCSEPLLMSPTRCTKKVLKNSSTDTSLRRTSAFGTA